MTEPTEMASGDLVEQIFIDNVWEVLKRDSNDLRKQQAILALFREARANVALDGSNAVTK